MKRLVALILSLILALSLCACSQDTQPQDEGKLQVMASCFPYYDFARAIGGEHVEPALLIAAGREVHSFEPTPLDVVRLSESDVFLYNGGESELWVEEILESAGENIAVTAAMMDYAPLLEEEIVEGMETSVHHHHHGDTCEEEHGHHEHEAAYDEHIWTSPVVAQNLCRAICEALCTADPAHRADYEANLASYLTQLQALDKAFRDVVADGNRTTMVFGDRFPLQYFCAEYGLTYSAAFHGCAGDTEPSLGTMKFLIDKVTAEQLPAVYTIELSSQKIASAIAETTNAKVLMFHSCQTVSRQEFDNGETYLSLMWHNVDVLKEGLA
ncbi:MAG: zinc ABC transporter substrate-binding protein [Oscillospiraceae bacterium]|nr:zinc ABC transporter substrate-binding protein [Oscillospiraceae bacterium]